MIDFVIFSGGMVLLSLAFAVVVGVVDIIKDWK